jgi:hypothetical protein
MSEEQKEKRRRAMKGRPSYVRTSESLAKQAAAMRGRKLSDETRARMSAAHKGKRLPDVAYRKMAETRRGKKYPRKPAPDQPRLF